MSKRVGMLAGLGLLFLSACVTINVYFPAAEAEQAAREFIDKVIGEEPPAKPAEPPAKQGFEGAVNLRGFSLLGLLISDAQAQSADINIRTPAIQAIQERMSERFKSQLGAAFDSGALGLGNDGLIVVRDPAKVALRERAVLTQAVADDNRDRNAVYREIAVANGHPEWEDQIRETFSRQWVASARAGWWYQDAAGGWKQK
jgi:uncharacterized protein YdbL (DUF1318 family)